MRRTDGPVPRAVPAPEVLLEALLACVPVALAVLDPAGRLLRVSRALAATVGAEPAGLIGVEATKALGVTARTLRGALTRLRREPEVSEVDLDPVVGAPAVDHRDVLVPLRDAQGALVAAALLRIDVSEQRGHERVRAAADARLELTGRASEVLGTSLDPAVTLRHLADLLVPALADHVFVDLAEEGGRLRRASIRHGHGVPVPDDLQRPVGHLVDYTADHPAHRAVTDGVTTLLHDVQAQPHQVPAGPDARLVAAMGVRSAMVVPMLVGGRPIGAVALLSSVSGRLYTASDLALAQELVSRAAVALANALSYEQQREAAVALQRSLLPPMLPDLEGVQVAWRYVPGTAGTQVGGDFAEAFELPGGRVAVVVGDVMGRGLRAAAVMGQVRTAVRTLAMSDPQPADLLARLDEVVAGLPSTQIVTCIYAVYDPARATMCLSNAGHLPPIVVVDGSSQLVAEAVSVPLGVGALSGAEFTQTELDLPAGATLVLYTDGLVERPGHDLDRDIARLAAELAAGPPGADLEEMCERALAIGPVTSEGGFEDDVALLVLRATAVPDGRVVTVRLPARPESAATARVEVSAALAHWGLTGAAGNGAPAVEVAELLVSEVVTNAIRYSRGPIELQVRRGQDALWFEIADMDSRLPRLRHAKGDDEGGRGLELVQALASGWGTREIADGKVVWFRLDLAEPDRRAVPARGVLSR